MIATRRLGRARHEFRFGTRELVIIGAVFCLITGLVFAGGVLVGREMTRGKSTARVEVVPDSRGDADGLRTEGPVKTAATRAEEKVTFYRTLTAPTSDLPQVGKPTIEERLIPKEEPAAPVLAAPRRSIPPRSRPERHRSGEPRRLRSRSPVLAPSGRRERRRRRRRGRLRRRSLGRVPAGMGTHGPSRSARTGAERWPKSSGPGWRRVASMPTSSPRSRRTGARATGCGSGPTPAGTTPSASRRSSGPSAG